MPISGAERNGGGGIWNAGINQNHPIKTYTGYNFVITIKVPLKKKTNLQVHDITYTLPPFRHLVRYRSHHCLNPHLHLHPLHHHLHPHYLADQMSRYLYLCEKWWWDESRGVLVPDPASAWISFCTICHLLSESGWRV